MNKKESIIFFIGILLGILLLAGVRFALYKDHSVHYHANFALYVNGHRDTFSGPGFYEEVASCNLDPESEPGHRVHMHDQINDVVHVHASGVTWGNFFENLGYSVSSKHILTTTNVLTENDVNKVTFILNGKEVNDISNTVIQSEDRLLVNYGNQDQNQINTEFNSVANTAKEVNKKPDPASCSGNSSSMSKRLKATFFFN